MTVPALYERVENFEAALDVMEERADEIVAAGGELPPWLDELLTQALAEVEHRAEAVALAARGAVVHIQVIDSEIQRLKALLRAYDGVQRGLKTYLMEQLRRAGLRRVDGDRAKIWRQRNSRPACRIVDVSEVPSRWLKWQVEGTIPDTHAALAVATVQRGIGGARPWIEALIGIGCIVTPALDTDAVLAEVLDGSELNPGESLTVNGVEVSLGEHVRIK